MRKLYLLALLALLGNVATASLKLTGTIGGKYKFSMELVHSDMEGYNIRGRYNYVGKTSSMDIKGNLYGGTVMHLEESYQGKETGEFFVEYDSDGRWTGKWIGGEKFFEVVMDETDGDSHELIPYDLDAFFENTSDALTGSYASEYYWINDFHFSEESPMLEVGFNGGAVVVEQLDKDRIRFNFELVCGPTYHMAYLEGIAKRVGPNKFLYKDSPMDDGEICEVSFTFANKTLTLDQASGNMECGFGARAYAGGDFMKVNNVAVHPEGDGTSVEDILPKK